MAFNLDQGIEILDRTPAVLETLLGGLSDVWTTGTEGPSTWSPYDVLGHLIHGERNDWMTRAELILSTKTDRTFATFDRFAQFQESRGKSLADLLAEFKDVRAHSLARLRALRLTPADLTRTGTHPKFGTVTLGQLLATWVAHDLDHLVQISRVMATQIRSDVGPWIEYLKVLRQS
jgi:uncharacterized damage-inducible protein DinB